MRNAVQLRDSLKIGKKRLVKGCMLQMMYDTNETEKDLWCHHVTLLLKLLINWEKYREQYIKEK